MSDDAEEIWAWLDPPLRNLTLGTAQESDLSWVDRRARLLTELGLSNPHDHPVAVAVFEWLDGLPEDERSHVIGGDQLLEHAYALTTQFKATQETAGGAAAADEVAGRAAGYEESAWTEYLGATLPRWDGTEESWPTWRDWFSHHAADRGLTTPAGQLAAYLDGMSNQGRIVTFAQYGTTVPAARPGGEPEGFDEVRADLAAEVPGAAQLSKADLAEVLAELKRQEARA